jgi:hypothetical protein
MKPFDWRRARGKRLAASDHDRLTEHLITALVLSLAHDLAIESRRKGVTGCDYIGDAVELIRRSRPHVLQLLGCEYRNRRTGENHARRVEQPGR